MTRFPAPPERLTPRDAPPTMATSTTTRGTQAMTLPARRKSLLSGCFCCGPVAGFTAAAVNRRNFIAGGAALGMGAATAGLNAISAPAQAQGKPNRIDVHHHIVPPAQRKMNIERHGGRGGPKWSPQMSLEDMDKGGVAYSLTSIINPGPWYGKIEDASRRLARECNDYAAKLRQDHPKRFGMFAAIAPVDTEGSLKEIQYAYEQLKAEGIALWTSYEGKYLGDPVFVPVLEELNRRKAVVYVHPTVPACCRRVVEGVSPSTFEYANETTRTVSSLFFSKPGSGFKFPDIRWIWSHSGGTIPFMTSRIDRLAMGKKFPREPMAVIKEHYYEIAQGNTPGQFAALMKMVSISQVLFGSDYPYRDAKEAVDGMTAYKFSAADQKAINNGNAMRLMPSIKV
jgi:predicted TIM-barrel fold metal-dependent hydrolase